MAAGAETCSAKENNSPRSHIGKIRIFSPSVRKRWHTVYALLSFVREARDRPILLLFLFLFCFILLYFFCVRMLLKNILRTIYFHSFFSLPHAPPHLHVKAESERSKMCQFRRIGLHSFHSCALHAQQLLEENTKTKNAKKRLRDSICVFLCMCASQKNEPIAQH